MTNLLRGYPGSPARRMPFALGLAALLVVVAGGYWVVAANRLGVTVAHGEISGTHFVIEQNDREPVVITVEPARRTEGTRVLVDGLATQHPPGPAPGQLLWYVGDLQPGFYELEVRVPRPTWFGATYTVEIEVQTAT